MVKALPLASESSHFDANQVPSLVGVQGTLGTSDVTGSAPTLPYGVDPATGAMYVNILAGAGAASNPTNGTLSTLGTVGTILGIGGTVQVSGASAGTNVNIVTGSQQTLGTVGTILGIGGTVQVAGASAGTNVNIVTGTQQTLGTVGTVSGVGTITNIGSISTIGTMPAIALALNTGTITTIAAGTQNTLGTVGVLNAGSLVVTVGTIGGKAASGAASVANPILIAGTDAGGTVYAPLVTAAGALTVTGASAGTNVNIVTGTLQSAGTVTGVGTLTNLGSLTNAGTIKEITNIAGGTITTTLALNTGTLTTIAAGTQNTLGTLGTILGIGGTVQVSGASAGTNVNIVSGSLVGTTTPSFAIAGGSTAAASGTVVGTLDVSSYRQVSVQVGGTWTGQLLFQASNDGVSWFDSPVVATGDHSNSFTNNTTANALFVGPVVGRYFRLTGNTLNSGTATGTAYFSAGNSYPYTMAVTASQNGGYSVALTSNTTGTIPQVTTVGTNLGMGTITNLGSFTNGGTIKEITNIAGGTLTTTLALNTGTLTTIAAGTQNTLGTVANLNNGSINILTGTTTLVSTVTTVSNLTNGSIVVTTGTVGGKAASGAAAVANPVLIAGTDTGGTIYAPVVDATGALKVAGAAAGTFVNIVTGSQQTLGTVGVLNAGSVVVTLGTVGGKAASGAASVANPVLISGTDSGGTIYAPLVTSAGALTVTGASAGTNVQIVNGTVTNVGTNVGMGTLTNLGSFTNGGTIKEITNIAGGTLTTTLALNTGTITTIAAGTQNTLGTVGTILGIGGTVQVSGASAGTNVNIVTGTQQTLGTVGVLNAGSLVVTSGTIATGSLSNLALINAGTITSVGLGTAYKGIAAATAGSLTAAGTITVAGSQLDTIYWDVGGTWVGTAFFEAQVGTSVFFGVPVVTPQGGIGSQTTGNGDFIMSAAGIDTARLRVTYSSGTLTHNERASNFFSPLQYTLGGTLGNIGMLNAGTVVQASGTTTLVSTVTTVSNLTNGSVNLLTGTVTSVGTNVGIGTLSNVGSVNTVTTVSNLTTGSVNLLTGTVTRVSNIGTLESGTVKLDPTPVPATLQFGTLGTAGGSFFGTLSAASGAGTKHYISGVDVVMQSGTADVRILAGTSIQGTGVLTAGQFPAGGGIAKRITPVFVTGTNSELIYHFVGAGTAFITVSYWKGV